MNFLLQHFQSISPTFSFDIFFAVSFSIVRFYSHYRKNCSFYSFSSLIGFKLSISFFLLIKNDFFSLSHSLFIPLSIHFFILVFIKSIIYTKSIDFVIYSTACFSIACSHFISTPTPIKSTLYAIIALAVRNGCT